MRKIKNLQKAMKRACERRELRALCVKDINHNSYGVTFFFDDLNEKATNYRPGTLFRFFDAEPGDIFVVMRVDRNKDVEVCDDSKTNRSVTNELV